VATNPLLAISIYNLDETSSSWCNQLWSMNNLKLAIDNDNAVDHNDWLGRLAISTFDREATTSVWENHTHKGNQVRSTHWTIHSSTHWTRTMSSEVNVDVVPDFELLRLDGGEETRAFPPIARGRIVLVQDRNSLTLTAAMT
jgi:hypothetical protein